MRRIRDYILEEVIGRGAYSTVFRCSSLTDPPKYYACKVFKRSRMNQRMLKNLHEESTSLKKLSGNPNIINALASFKTKKNFYLVVEFCNGGDLESLIEAGLQLSERQVSYIFREVLRGMKEMNSKGILHRDIKNANILIHLTGSNSETNRRGSS